jgi:hypothetical protein
MVQLYRVQGIICKSEILKTDIYDTTTAYWQPGSSQ